MANLTASSAGFKSEGYIKDLYICYKTDFIKGLVSLIKSLLGVKKSDGQSKIKARYSIRKAKGIVLRNKLAVVDGSPSWFYTAFEVRGGHDPLTNCSLKFIESNISKKARILVTGCGVGITAFHLADCAFLDVAGIDVIPECISVANQIKDNHLYSNNSFYADDCFHPALNGSFDVITAMHWVFSAWAGNYGNAVVDNAKDPKVRKELLSAFLATYAPHMNTDGILIIELIDAVADYRISTDHPMGDLSLGIYPVRHTPQQVELCARLNGFSVIDKKLCVSYGRQPRTSYILEKM